MKALSLILCIAFKGSWLGLTSLGFKVAERGFAGLSARSDMGGFLFFLRCLMRRLLMLVL